MPYGAGTYGKQVGRPSNDQKDMGKSPLKNAISNQVASKKAKPSMPPMKKKSMM